MQTKLKRIKKNKKRLTISDLRQGDIFIFFDMGDEDNVYMMGENVYMSLSSGYEFSVAKFGHYEVLKAVQTEPLKVEVVE